MSLSEYRTVPFRRNELLEGLLSELNKDLCNAEELLIARYSHTYRTPFPVILIMGPLRSGTTLFMQWLADTGLVAYPTNLLSRFYGAPIIGAKIQLLLTDSRFNFRNELGEFSQQVIFKSENGKTEGVLAPNEFWYFWRRLLAEPARDVWSDDELRENLDTETMLAELMGIMDVFQKPFAAKGMLFNYNIPFLNSVLDRVIFVQMRRDPVTNVASVMEARRRQLGSELDWYSFKIPEFEMLRALDPVAQAAGQVYFNAKAVARGLSEVPENRKIVVDYEQFCADPQRYHGLLCRLLGIAAPEYCGPQEFLATRSVSGETERMIRNALDQFDTGFDR